MKVPNRTRRTRREKRVFDARRLHNLLVFVEHPRTPEERAASGESVLRALRRHLADFYRLEDRLGGEGT